MPAALRSRAEVVAYGVDVERMRSEGADRAAVRAELGIGPDALVVGTVANLRPVKAYPDLLAAAALVVAALPRCAVRGGGTIHPLERGASQ